MISKRFQIPNKTLIYYTHSFSIINLTFKHRLLKITKIPLREKLLKTPSNDLKLSENVKQHVRSKNMQLESENSTPRVLDLTRQKRNT